MTEYAVLGKPVPRVDTIDKVTGSAKYTADLFMPGMLYGKALRSPYGHAKILSIDTSKAEKLPGVRAVVTGREIPPLKFGITREQADQYLLAIDKVRYLGEEVAAVAADDEDTAEEALSLIKVDYEPLPVVLDAFEAMKEGAPQLHDHVKGNISTQGIISSGDVEKALRESYRVYEDSMTTAKISHVQMEPYAVLASCDAQGRIDLWVPSAAPFQKRKALSNNLKIPVMKIRIHHVNVGGAFGGRSDTYPPEFIATLLTMKAKRPVKIVYSREETQFATRHKASVTMTYKVGLSQDGRILAKDAKIIVDGGAYTSSSGIATFQPYLGMESVHKCDNLRYEGIRVYTNKTPCSMHRLFGNQLVMLEEMVLERAAEDLGIDPVEMKLKNARETGDVLPSSLKLTSFALKDSIKVAMAASGWKEKKGKLPPGRGIGMAIGDCYTGFAMGFRLNASSTIKFNEDGSCSVFSGLIENGQGNETMAVQIASELLGIPMEDIELISADTGLCSQEPGSYSMTTTYCSGHAVRLAALDARQQMLALAADRMKVPASELDIRDRKVFVKNSPEKAMTVEDVVRQGFRIGKAVQGKGSYTPPSTSQYGWVELTSTAKGQRTINFTPGTTVAEVEVDKETGVVKVLNLVAAYDCGFAINPMNVEGQWQGGVVQAMGEALYEGHEWAKDGKLLTDSFLDYRIPTAVDVPLIKAIIVDSIDPDGPFGAKEGGINGTPGGTAAISNAIHDATGVWVKSIPITPDKVLKAIKEQQGK